MNEGLIKDELKSDDTEDVIKGVSLFISGCKKKKINAGLTQYTYIKTVQGKRQNFAKKQKKKKKVLKVFCKKNVIYEI